MIQKLASTSSVDVRESYMKPLEHFVREHHEGLKVVKRLEEVVTREGTRRERGLGLENKGRARKGVGSREGRG